MVGVEFLKSQPKGSGQVALTYNESFPRTVCVHDVLSKVNTRGGRVSGSRECALVVG